MLPDKQAKGVLENPFRELHLAGHGVVVTVVVQQAEVERESKSERRRRVHARKECTRERREACVTVQHDDVREAEIDERQMR